MLFKGKTAADKQICIKFVRRYGQDVHLWCAKEGFAPHLIAFEKLLGDWYMVVMDFLDISWRPISAAERKDDGALEGKIRDALVKLHQHHMVHGDVRDTNIMVRDSGRELEFMLIDFDWAGELGTVKYPRLVNKAPELGRPTDVEDGELINAEHDLVMLRHLFSPST